MFKGRMEKQNFGLSPPLKLPPQVGLSRREISEALRSVQEHENEIRNAWLRHFPS